MEQVAAAARGHKWFQLYAAGGRSEADRMIGRARNAGYEALVVTVDTPALGNRERDVRNGVNPPLRLDARTAISLGPQVLARPRWAARMIRDGVSMLRRSSPPAPTRPPAGPPSNRPPAAAGGREDGLGATGTVSMLASPFTWADIEWMRAGWDRPLVVKGVLSAEDACRAVDCGANAVIVSNHGGRQLDGAPATARVLPEIADAVGQSAEVLIDGGIRRGGDVVKALALGARAVLIGRPYLYGLAVSGEQGVLRVLDILRTEMQRTMCLLGCPSVTDLDHSWLTIS
jgi:isopentenyl diphosphate isomerase/L-lactate dehydrogenase-like FMN-dependent dehydrogenase